MVKLGWLYKNMVQRAGLFSGLLAHRYSGKLQPLIANLFITGHCNARCVYCYVEDVNAPGGFPKEKRRMTGDDWKNLIDRLIDRGTRYFTLVGGEPTLSPHFDEIVDYLHRRGVFFNLTSNGSLVPRKKDLIAKVSQLTISIDGDEHANDQLRGDGWHKIAVDAIKAAVAAGIPVRLSIVVTKANVDQTPYILDLCEEYNMFVTFTPCIDTPEFRREEMEKWRLSDAETKEFFIDLKKWKVKSSRIMNSFESIDFMIDYPVAFAEVVMNDAPEADYYDENCPYGRIQYHFNEFGEVYPCGVWWNREDFKALTVFEEGDLDRAIANATELPCSYCSFCNFVDWNELSKPRAIFEGISLTLQQSKGAKSNCGRAEVAE